MAIVPLAIPGLLLLIALFGGSAQAGTKLVFLDVGQGDALLLQDGAQQILIDGGAGSSVLARLGEEMPWYDRRLDVLVATHPDKDHLEGLWHVLNYYEVGLVILPEIVQTSALQEAWLDELHGLAIPYRFAKPGQRLTLGPAVLDVLGPTALVLQRAVETDKPNNASVITRIGIHGSSFLLTGDAEEVVERALIAQYGESLQAQVLKLGHHGSKTSTTQDFLEAVRPVLAVVSVGAENSYGHPHPTVLDRVAHVPVLRTDEAGSILFEWVGGELLLSCGGKKCIK